MNYINFSKSYHVRMLTECDIPLILRLCEKNTQFYEHCPPFVTAESIRDDMCALPQRKMDESQEGTWHWKQDHHRAVCVSTQSGLRVYPAGLCGWQQAK